MFLCRAVRISDNWNGEERHSHMKICVQGLGVNSKGTSHQVHLRTSPTNYSMKKKELNNKCALLIYYKIINKYIFIRYSFKPFLMCNIIMLYSYILFRGKFSKRKFSQIL